jgi:hypothetical protein
MTEHLVNDLQTEGRLQERSHCQHAGRDIAALPPNLSYPKGPITLAVPGLFKKCGCTPAERLGGAIRHYTEITGIGPFDFQNISPVPEPYQSRMKRSDDEFCVIMFEFDSMEEALAVEAKFNAINRHVDIWAEEEEREDLRSYFEQIEEDSDERPTYDGGDGCGEMYWRDHAYFQEGWREYLQEIRRPVAAPPEKFSQQEKSITLQFPVMFTKRLGSTEEQLADAVRHFTKVVGIVPIDWQRISPVPEPYQCQMRAPDDAVYVLRFRFETMDEALAAKASLEAIDCHVGVITEEG